MLDATNVSPNECFEIGEVIWRATLPARTIAASSLPVTFKAEVMLRAAGKQQRVPGSVSVVSADRMIVASGDVAVRMTRGSKLPTDDARASTADSNRDAAVSDEGMSGLAPAGPAADGGEGNAASGSDGSKPAAASGTAGSGDAGNQAIAVDAGTSRPAGGPAAAGSGTGGRSSSPASGGGAGAAAPTAGRAAILDGGLPPSAGTDAAVPAAGRGSNTFPDGGTGTWSCINTIGGCTCSLDAQPGDGDECTNKPPCCHAFTDSDGVWCQCWPTLNPACYSQSQDEMVGKTQSVPTCPPP